MEQEPGNNIDNGSSFYEEHDKEALVQKTNETEDEEREYGSQKKRKTSERVCLVKIFLKFYLCIIFQNVSHMSYMYI